MKIKKLLITVGAVASAFFMGVSPITAFAHSNEEESICEEEESSYEEDDEQKETAQEDWGPLTPDGNLELVDDYGTLEAGGKQFITVVTKAGNYFYIIIDRDDNGAENVHFLNMVDESDLLALMDDEEVEEYMKKTGAREEEPTVVAEPVPEEPKEEVVEVRPKKNGASIIVLVFLFGGVAVAGYLYFKDSKGKKEVNEHVDPDADYIEDDEDYLEQVLEDEDSDEEEMENDQI